MATKNLLLKDKKYVKWLDENTVEYGKGVNILPEVDVYPDGPKDALATNMKINLYGLKQQGYLNLANKIAELYRTQGGNEAYKLYYNSINRINDLKKALHLSRVVSEKKSVINNIRKPINESIKSFGNTLLKGLLYFGNAQIAGDSGASTAAATASGYKYNPQTHMWEQSEENIKEAEGLRNSLPAISTFSPTHPTNVLLKGLGYLFRWRPFLPTGSETTVYRLGGMDMIDDALESGVIKPIDLSKTTATNIKAFKNNLMFNRIRPFYGNPGLFKNSSKGVFVGNMNKSSAQWRLIFHKGHKNIFEPFMNGSRQVPVSEFDIYIRAPFNFGWFKNINHTNINNGIFNALLNRLFKTKTKASSSKIINNNTGKILYTPDEIVNSGDFAKGKEMAAKFFEHPVVIQSYKHNQRLAKKLGIVIPDKPNAALVVRLPVTVTYGTTQDPNAIAEVTRSHFGALDDKITMNWRAYTWDDLKDAVMHENLHRGWYSAPLNPLTVSKHYYEKIFKPEYKFWKLKTDRLLNDVGKADNYLSDVLSGEAGPNLIDLGRGLGLKLGQKYPGYDAAIQMLKTYKGSKAFLIPRLNLTKAGMRHVWAAMTGRYFIPTVGISTVGISTIDK